MRPGVRFALDLGQARIGVAKCDASAMLASPFEVWSAGEPVEVAQRLGQLIAEYEPLEFVVGLPTALSGNEETAAARVRETVNALSAALPGSVFRLVDERMTTVAARRHLQASGYTTRTDKQLIDAAAATILLEDALESERRQGIPPGEVVA